MKGNISPNSSNKKTFSFSNIFLISLIAFLSLIIIFLSYSLFTKIHNASAKKNEKDKNVASAIIVVEVMNGSGVNGIATKFKDYLRQKNFDVVQVGNYRSDNVEETMIIDRIGNRANAEKLAEVLGIDKKKIIQQLNKDYLLDATLVIGKDFNKLEPLN